MYRLFLFAVALVLPFASCSNKQEIRSQAEQVQQQPKPQTQSRGNLQKIMVDTTTVWVEIAQDNLTRTKGLMFRNDMPEDQGMLFIFEVPQILSFWMKNTYLPLDIAFIDPKGIITDIHQMAPLDTVPRYASSVPTLYALEVNQGFFAKKGIRVGNVVHMY